MPIMFSRTVLLLLVAAPLVLCAQDARVVTRIVTDASPAWKVWKADGFSMNYPNQWTFSEPAEGDTLVVFSKLEADGVQPLVKVCVQDARERPGSGDQDRSNAVVTDHEDGKTVIERNSDGIPVRVMEMIVSEDGRPFRLSYSAPSESFEEFLFMAEAMINSFAVSTEAR